jgi:hypothetical protein
VSESRGVMRLIASSDGRVGDTRIVTNQRRFVRGDARLRLNTTSALWRSVRLVSLLIFSLPVAAILLATVIAVDSQRGGTFRRPAGTFAGYLWRGPVASVGASWIVPRILPESQPGRAATWVGAQNQELAFGFIQLGVEEIRFPTRGGRRGADLYRAVWSDRRLHELLHPLFNVSAGDEVSAHLARAHGRWLLALVDRTVGRAARFSTTQEADRPFNQAEWIQEDPPERAGGSAGPYPQLTAVAFRRLEVNAAAPTHTGLRSLSMSADGVHFGPSPVQGDGFMVGAVTLSRPGA